MSDNIDIVGWATLEIERLAKFTAFWINGADGEDPNGSPAEAFPEEMPAEEWDEQYRSWGGG